jgi:mevalonate kinase
LVRLRDGQLIERFGFKDPGLPLKHRARSAPSSEKPSTVRKRGYACGKIIISGNISNSYGKRALAVPVDMHIAVTWDPRGGDGKNLAISWAGQKEAGVWITTARKIIALLGQHIGPVRGKLTIRNTLPLGKGMGSSTSIIVALARCFLGQDCKEEALAIENIINAGHSGIDFAAIWEERPIIIAGDKYEFTDLPKGLQHGFLIDTGQPVEPTSVILQRLHERAPKEKSLMKCVEKIGNCTDRLLSGEDPLTVFPDHHRGQVDLGLIPPRVQMLIEKIEQLGGAAKATRSGGPTGGVGMVFAVHPKDNLLNALEEAHPVALTYDPDLRRFINRRNGHSKPS